MPIMAAQGLDSRKCSVNLGGIGSRAVLALQYLLDTQRGFRFASPGFSLDDDCRTIYQSQIAGLFRPADSQSDRHDRGCRASGAQADWFDPELSVGGHL